MIRLDLNVPDNLRVDIDSLLLPDNLAKNARLQIEVTIRFCLKMLSHTNV
jgi:hypothetical protein